MHLHRTDVGIAALCICTLIYASCSQFLIQDLEVTGFAYDLEKVTLTFSSAIDGEKVKKAFSFTESGKVSNGIFFINDSSLYFYPENGIQKNHDYEVILNTQAEDVNGNSLKEKFSYRFSTKINSVRPQILTVTPSDGTIMEEDFNEIKIVFSEPVLKSSFSKAFYIEPSVEHTVVFNESSAETTVKFLEPISKGKSYAVRISTELKDLFNNSIAEEFVCHFQVGNDDEPPEYEIFYSDENEDAMELKEFPSENHFIPKDALITLKFNEKINLDYIGSYIELTPSAIKYSYESDKQQGNLVKIKIFGKYNDSCTLKIKKGIEDLQGNETKHDRKYSLLLNSEKSRPVTFCKAFLQTDSMGNYRELSFKTQYTHVNLDPIYFANDRTSKEAYMFLAYNVSSKSNGVDFFSAVDALSFRTTNTCLSIIIKKAEVVSVSETGFILDENEIDEGKLSVLKYTLNITNTNREGLVEMNISDAVKDSLGNEIEGPYCLAFNK